MKSLMKVLTVSILFTANAFAVQHFTCFPPDIHSNDRVVISLKNDLDGTLFLTSGINEWGHQVSSGVLLMTKTGEKGENQVWVANNTKSVFTVQIPKKVIGKNLNDVDVILNLKSSDHNVTQELNCYTRMY